MQRMRNVIREKRIQCGQNYMEVDIYNFCRDTKTGRAKKEKASLPSQKNLNEKNAKRAFIQTAEANFKEGDIYLTLTYNEKFLPGTIKEAMKEVENYIRRVRREMKKLGLKLKYMIVTEYRTEKETAEDEDDARPIRIHHHILMSAGLDRDTIENLWRKRRKKGQVEGEKIGRANARIIQPDDNTGIFALASYLAKNPKGKRRWTCSKNLERPVVSTNDFKYSRRKVLTIIRDGVDFSFWEKMYPGWEIRDKDGGYRQEYNDFTGWSIYLKLRRRQRE